MADGDRTSAVRLCIPRYAVPGPPVPQGRIRGTLACGRGINFFFFFFFFFFEQVYVIKSIVVMSKVFFSTLLLSLNVVYLFKALILQLSTVRTSKLSYAKSLGHVPPAAGPSCGISSVQLSTASHFRKNNYSTSPSLHIDHFTYLWRIQVLLSPKSTTNRQEIPVLAPMSSDRSQPDWPDSCSGFLAS